jgi:hypothetical protein
MIRVAFVFALTIAASLALIVVGNRTTPAANGAAYPGPSNTVYFPLVYGAPSCSAPPTLIGPANGSSLTTLVPFFQWQPVADLNATAMVLEVATDPSFVDASLVADISFGPTSAIWTNGGTRLPGNFNPLTTYYWHVYVECGNTQGPLSPAWSLTSAPQTGEFLPPASLTLPSDGTVVPANSVTLQWSAVTGAIDYLVVWYPATSLSSFDFAYVSGTSLNIGPLFANTTYEWYVQARNDYADGIETNPVSFNTSATVTSQSAAVQRAPAAIASGTMRRPAGPAKSH